jgi:hypothetical protein
MSKPGEFYSLKNPAFCYLMGLGFADAHLRETTRNRGSFSLELSVKDKDIIYKLYSLLPEVSRVNERIRNTNFAKSKRFFSLNVFRREFREALKKFGFPVGAKSKTLKIPKRLASSTDFWRGLMDGDGSVGFASSGRAFVSFNTSSEAVALEYLRFLKRMFGLQKACTRNARDHSYNIAVWDIDAQRLCLLLYPQRCVAISRKHRAARRIVASKQKVRAVQTKTWLPWEDRFIQNHSITTSMKKLGRTEKSIKMRVWRLRHGVKSKERLAA